MRILLVEDDSIIAELFIERLSMLGHDVKWAIDGVDGYSVYSEDQSFDLIISDVRMPNLNGIDFVKRIRRKFPHIDSKIVFCTSEIYNEKDMDGIGLIGWYDKLEFNQLIKDHLHE